MENERRISNRVNQILPAWYRHDDGPFVRSRAFAVGANGARIVTDAMIERNSCVDITLKLDGQMVSVTGTARWHRPADDYSGRYLVGVEFDVKRGGDLRRFHRWHYTEKLKERCQAV